MLVLKSNQPERYLRLETFCKRPFFSASDAYEMGTTKESRRIDIAEALVSEVTSVDPSRLMALLGKALQYQHSEGKLPVGSHYDLFRGARKAARRDIDEKVTKLVLLESLSHAKELKPNVFNFAPDGQCFTVGGKEGYLEIWDTESFSLRKDLEYQNKDQFIHQDSPVSCCTFSKDGDHVALGLQNGHIKIWKISTGQCLKTLSQAHNAGINSLVFSKDGTQLLSSSFDHTARIHGLKSGKSLREFRGHTSYVNYALFSKDASASVITASSDGTVKYWDSRTTECLVTIR